MGIAWDVFGNGKTAFRAGYGMGYTPNFGNVTFNVIQNPPNYGVIALTAGTDVPTIPITTENAGPLAGSSGTKTLSPVSLRAVNPYIKTASAHLWNASIEHAFNPGLILSLDYSGSRGVNLYTINRLNIPGSSILYAGTGSTSARINPQYSYINYRTNGGFSNYNGLNTRLEMRNFLRSGVSFRMNYTWSHAIDNISSTFSETNSGSGNLGLLDPLNPRLDRGNADFDVRHRFSLAGIYEVPFKGQGISRRVFGGWSFIPNWSVRTGTPFSLWDCTNAQYVLCPRAMYSTPFAPSYTQTPTGQPNQFNYMSVGTPYSAYVNPVVGASDFGPFPSAMTGRNAFRGPGFWNLDFAVHKNIAVTERVTVQLRAEAYNIFNHSNLYPVLTNTDVSVTKAVTATRGVRADNSSYNVVSTDNRNLQLALKVLF